MNTPHGKQPLLHGKERSGFTLMELLIVLGVMLILAVFLGVAWNSASKNALALRNVNHHRQIITGLLAYTSDHAGSFPYAFDDTATPKMSWPRLLVRSGYLSDPTVFFSPLANHWYEREGRVALRNPDADSLVPWCYPNYAVNRHGAMPYGRYNGSYPDGSRKPARLSRVAKDGNLSKLMVLRDVYHPSYPDRGGGVESFTGSQFMPPPEKTYSGRVYASFADGHVEAFRRDEFRTLLNNAPAASPPLFTNLYTYKP